MTSALCGYLTFDVLLDHHVEFKIPRFAVTPTVTYSPFWVFVRVNVDPVAELIAAQLFGKVDEFDETFFTQENH